MVVVLAAIIIHLERFYARGYGDNLIFFICRWHIDGEIGQVVGERRSNCGYRAGHSKGGGIVIPFTTPHGDGIAAGVRYADAAKHVTACGISRQSDGFVYFGRGGVCCDAATLGGIDGNIILLIGGNDKRHRQVEAYSIKNGVSSEVERHEFARADFVDTGLGAAQWVA